MCAERKTGSKDPAREAFSPSLPAEAMNPPKLDPFKGVTATGLEGNPRNWHKQWHTTQRGHDRLGAEFPGSYRVS